MMKKNKKKSNYARRTRTPQKTSPFAWLAIGILIGLIIPSIFLIKSHATKEDLTKIDFKEQNQTPSTYKPKSKIVEAKNVPPKPQYEFYNLLASQEEETSKNAETASTSPAQFFLQIAKFNSYQDADQLKAKLLLAGVENISVTKKTLGKQTSYEVLAGPFKSKDEANKAYQNLKEKLRS